MNNKKNIALAKDEIKILLVSLYESQDHMKDDMDDEQIANSYFDIEKLVIKLEKLQ